MKPAEKPASQNPEEEKKSRARRILVTVLLLMLVSLLAWFLLRKCSNEEMVGKNGSGGRAAQSLRLADSLRRADSLFLADSLSEVLQILIRDSLAQEALRADSLKAADSLLKAEERARAAESASSPPDAPGPESDGPLMSDTMYVYADPWGGRHFDSVMVTLHCRGECFVMYSMEDSIQLVSYEQPLRILRNRTLWIAGMNEKGERSPCVRVDYIIEKKKGRCGEGMMPVDHAKGTVCMDVYEWPNRKGDRPAVYVSRQDAADSCAGAGKRLCLLEEWQAACAGPDGHRYPYGNVYNENYCPAKEQTFSRSGRFPACRSYYGIYDLAGNLWEWTGTQARSRQGYYMAAGGNWDTGGQAACSQEKYSFFPQNRYLFLGFRCCENPGLSPDAGP